tara:strand:+ start:1288 stop:1506 length:219 start_codon:yes stop_codon:yes gene_type:complete
MISKPEEILLDWYDTVRSGCDLLATDEEIQLIRETLKLQREALEEIRDVAAVSEGVEFYAMLAEKGLNYVKS